MEDNDDAIDKCIECPKLPIVIMIIQIVDNMVIPVLCIAGIIGNGMSIMILKNPQLRSTFHQSLVALGVCDIFFLGFILLDTFADLLYPLYIILFPYVINPMKNILLSLETFMIMSISAERFLAVYKPLQYRNHQMRISVQAHFVTFVLPAIILAIMINIPKFFEMKLTTMNRTNENNETLKEYEFELTPLKLDPMYTKYYTHWVRLICTGVVPFLFLLVINITTIISIRKSKKTAVMILALGTLPATVRDQLAHKEKMKSRSSKNLVLTLTTIVILYLICNIPRLLLNVFDHVSSTLIDIDFCRCRLNPEIVELFIVISHLMLVINSSSNFLIYFSLSRSFKNILLMKYFNRRSTRTQENTYAMVEANLQDETAFQMDVNGF